MVNYEKIKGNEIKNIECWEDCLRINLLNGECIDLNINQD